ncbi:MAG: serine protease [bacterium]
MKKLFPFLLAFVCMISFSCAWYGSKVLVHQTKSCVVTVVICDSEGKKIKQGSGFFIDDIGGLATSAYLIRGASKIRVYEGDTKGKFLTARVINPYLRNGISVLQLPGKWGTSVRFDFTYIPTIGDKVVAIGMRGNGQTASEGVIVGFKDFQGKKYIEFSGVVSEESTGAPLLNMEGKVIGVVDCEMNSISKSEKSSFALKFHK